MKTENDTNFQKLEIIRRVTSLCDDSQIEKINDFIFKLWEEEEEQERKDKKEFEEWRSQRV